MYSTSTIFYKVKTQCENEASLRIEEAKSHWEAAEGLSKRTAVKAVQTEAAKTHHVALTVKPAQREASTSADPPATASVGVGLCKLDDVLCDKCSAPKKSIGLNTDYVECETCRAKKSSQTVGLQTCIPSRSVAVETTPSSPVRTPSTPGDEVPKFGNSPVTICDKCHATITSLAAGMVSDSSSDLSPTKIPKLSEKKTEPSVASQSQPAKPSAEKREKPSSLPLKEVASPSKPGAKPIKSKMPIRQPSDRQSPTTNISGSQSPSVARSRIKTPETARKTDDYPLKSSLGWSSDDECSLAPSSMLTYASSITSMDENGKKRRGPSRGMRAALKVLNDSIGRPVRSDKYFKYENWWCYEKGF